MTEKENIMARPGPVPFTPEVVAKTIIRFLKIDPNDRYACEHGCEHTAIEYVEGQLRQMIDHAR